MNRQVTTEVKPVGDLVGEVSSQTLRRALGLKNSEHLRKTYLLPALKAGLIEMTVPAKPYGKETQPIFNAL